MKRKMLLGIALFSVFALASCKDGQTPYIGENGNWWIGDVDQGVPARGEKGEDGTNGVSVVSISKTSTVDNVDTYTVTFSNNTTSTFTVTNGINGTNGVDGEDADALTITNVSIKSSTNNVDTYEIEFSDGYKSTFTVTNGKDGKDGMDGKNLSVLSIAKISSEGKYDTYKISFSDNSYQTFVVKNGEDGLTPYIGVNGNWWIGEEDTGVVANGEKANNVPLTAYSSGLTYETRTINGISGYVVTGWNGLDDEYLISTYGQEIADSFSDLTDKTLVIPNYIGTVPVIGVMSNSQLNFKKVVLSKNTIYLDQAVFKNCSNLKEIDFNDCKINEIPMECFNGTALTSIDLPETVTHIFDKAFYGVPVLSKIDLKNVKYLGNQAFDESSVDYVYLSNNVEYVGNDVFESAFVYIQTPSKPSNWGSISSNAFSIKYNVEKNDEYLYSIENNEATIYQYLGNEKKLIIPATLDNKPITTIGSGFNSYIYDRSVLSGKTAVERYEYFTNVEGIEELIIGNNVKKIEEYSLMNGNMFVYIGKNVEEIELTEDDDFYIGFFYESDIEDGDPFGLVVLEDSSNVKFKYRGTIYTYDELLALDDDYEMFIKTNIVYDDIYYDENSKIYYAKDNLSYEVISCKQNYVDNINILDSIGSLPVKTIGKYAFEWIFVSRITIGNNVNKIKSYAFYQCKASLFIPNNVGIINANGIYINSGSIIYAEVSQKPDDWDTNWNPNNTLVVYSASKQSFDNMIITDSYIGVIKGDNTIELLQYLGSYNTTIKIPRIINGRTVTSIAADCFKTTSRYSNLKIYIPNTITNIETKAFDLYQYSYTAYIYLESNVIPSTYETNWYYNSYYSNNTSYISCVLGTTFDY